jgi:leucyl-tRNA synthetase
MSERYDPNEIEPKWQRVWADERASEVANPAPDEAAGMRKSYVLEQLPYP